MTRSTTWRRAVAGLVVGVVAALAVATATEAGTERATGSPITVMTIAPVQVQFGTPYENIFEASRVYSAWINAHGGIKGHPLKVITCDDKGDPNQAESCARKAVSSKVAAVVGAFSANDSRIVPVLGAASIAYFGTCCGFSNEDFTSSNSFPLGSQWALNIGLAAAAAKYCNNIGLVNFDVPGYKTFLDGLYATALKGYGKSIKAEAYVPLGAQDLSPQVAQVTQGTDCILLGVTESQIIPFLAAMQQAGAHQRLIGLQGNLSNTACAPHWSLCENAIVDSVFPTMSEPALATYRHALKSYKAKGGLDYNSLGGIGTWAAFSAFTNLLQKMTGGYTAPSILEAASTATVSNGGITPRINFKYGWNLPGFTRMFNRTVRFEIIKNKRFVPLDSGFHDMSPGFVGKKAGF